MSSFARLAVLATLALPTLAAATPVEAVARGSTSPSPPVGGNCNTGSMQCCNSVTTADDKSIVGLLGLVGATVGSITGIVGLNCSPVTAVGLGGGDSCSAHPVCCTNNAVGGLISVGCIPISL